MDNQEYTEIMERLDFIEFRQDLIFSGSELDRSIYEYRLTKKQYTKIMTCKLVLSAEYDTINFVIVVPSNKKNIISISFFFLSSALYC